MRAGIRAVVPSVKVSTFKLVSGLQLPTGMATPVTVYLNWHKLVDTYMPVNVMMMVDATSIS